MSELNYEDYEDYEDLFIPRGGGGGAKHRKEDSLTSATARKEATDNAEVKRVQDNESRLTNTLENLYNRTNEAVWEKTLQTYTEWVNESLKTGLKYNEETDIDLETFRSSGPGGQNVNNTSSAVRLRHKASGIFAESREESSQFENRRKARERLLDRLDEHVADWKHVVKQGEQEVTVDKVKSLLSESPEQRV